MDDKKKNAGASQAPPEADVFVEENIDVETILQEYDRESNTRKLPGRAGTAMRALLLLFSAISLYINVSGKLPIQMHRALFIGCTIFIAFMLFPESKHTKNRDKIPWYDFVCGIVGAASFFYIIVNFESLVYRAGAYTSLDVVFGILGILSLVEVCRRAVGLPIIIVVVCFILYAYFGNYIPGFFGHRGFTAKRIVTHLFYTTEGVIGTPLGVCSTFIFLFILFGSVLDKTGIARFFIDIANSIAGAAVGGPAKVAVIASGLQGMISGSSVANTVGSGSFTIPMMKRMGYKPEFAGAVEAAASTGGQIMPPVMGAAAFLMVEMTGESYAKIASSAILPAILYFLGIFLMIHFCSKHLGLKGMPKDEMPKFGPLFLKKGFLLLPLVVIAVFLGIGRTPTQAALIAIVTAVACGMFNREEKFELPSLLLFIPLVATVVILALNKGAPVYVWLVLLASSLGSLYFKLPRGVALDFVDALENGARNVLGVAIACGMAGMIVGIVTLTGVGLKLASGLLALSGNIPILALFFTMIACIILGMGVPTTANYVIMATICAPIVIQLGVPTLAAHMFVFYFGIVADITPPVALAAYAGSAIAHGNPFKTGVEATKLAIAAFLVPYIFAFAPEMLLIDTNAFEVIQIVISSIVGMVGIAAGVQGFALAPLKWYERIILFAGGLALIKPGWITDLIGIVCIGGIFALQYMAQKRTKAAA